MIKILDYGGQNIKNAIVILGAESNYEGVKAEYFYIVKRFGTKEINWTFKSQHLISNNDKYYDKLVIKLKNGIYKHIFFEITDFFGKKPEAFKESIKREREIKNNPNLSPLEKIILLNQMQKINKKILIFKKSKIKE